jgi:2'-5' RNA ligase
MRLFCAIELPPTLKRTLIQWQETLARDLGKAISWTPAENLHITLKFIGEMDAAGVVAVHDLLSVLPRVGAMELSIAGLLRFPARGPARIIAAGVADSRGCAGGAAVCSAHHAWAGAQTAKTAKPGRVS